MENSPDEDGEDHNPLCNSGNLDWGTDLHLGTVLDLPTDDSITLNHDCVECRRPIITCRHSCSVLPQTSSRTDIQHHCSRHEPKRYLNPLQRGATVACFGEEQAKLDTISLREWLTRPGRVVDCSECLFIFAQVVEIVEFAHSHGALLQSMRPSCFRVSPLAQISLIESPAVFYSSAFMLMEDDSEKTLAEMHLRRQRRSEEVGNNAYNWRIVGTEINKSLQNHPSNSSHRNRANWADQGINLQELAKDAHGESSSSQDPPLFEDSEDCNLKIEKVGENNHGEYWHFRLNRIFELEKHWYTSPEELKEGSCTFSSNIYALGILFFELFCTFTSEVEQSKTMSDIGHRIPPPQVLQRWPRELAFCLWLLHPTEASRPNLSAVLQSEMVKEGRGVLEEWKMAHFLEDEIGERDLLLDFLYQVQQRKEEAADKLCVAIDCLNSDANSVQTQLSVLNQKRKSSPDLGKERKAALGWSVDIGRQLQQRNEFSSSSNRKKHGKLVLRSKISSRSTRVLKNFKELEKVYFSMRTKSKPALGNSSGRYPSNKAFDKGSVPGLEAGKENCAAESNVRAHGGSSGLDRFFDSLSKYVRYSRFRVKASLRQGDSISSSGLVRSVAFDRDKEYFATAGFNKKIKVFEYKTVLNEKLDIHYPVTEMNSKSQHTTICWNSYIKSYIVSSACDGSVQLWDMTRNNPVINFQEHQRKVWSVDFSQTDPTKLASGGDDCAVKLWSINQERSIGTVKAAANVCCVQFSPNSASFLAFGTADYCIYCYDLRNVKQPWCILYSHSRPVSNIRFLDSSSLVSASTDNTLKLWDLGKPSDGAICDPVMTYSGHKNEKNFVGLSVADGYIATGSESNEVFVYHKSIPIPVTSFKFSSVDPMNGQEIEDDIGQFVSCVCWRGSSQTLVAANSRGNIKFLEMV